MRTRTDCDCRCHEPGINVSHVVACCRPDQEPICGESMWTRFLAAKGMDPCICLLAPHDENTPHMCRHDLDDVA